jgi:PEP-CTERM motif
VGDYDIPRVGAHGFLYSDGLYTTLELPGSINTLATGINDADQIVGSADYSHGFLATPVPEPSTLLLLAIGTLGVIGWAWRRPVTACRASREGER